MHCLVLDTNILHQEGLNSRNMQRLGRLARAGKVEILVPTLVRREFVSKRAIDSLEQLHRAQKELKDVARRLEFASDSAHILQSIDASLSELRTKVSEQIDHSYRVWFELNRVRELPFEPGSVSKVIDEYFAGTGAFRKPKHRDDVVDAMISHSIQAFAKDGKVSYVALHDGAFKTHLASLGTLHVVGSVAEFLEVPDVLEELGRLDKLDAWAELTHTELAGQPFQQRLCRYLTSGRTDLLEFIYLQGDEELEGSELLVAQPNWGITLNGVVVDQNTRINLTSVRFDSERTFSVGVVVSGTGRLDYAAWYSTEIHDSEKLMLVSLKGDGACELREYKEVLVSGYLSITFSNEIKGSDLIDEIERGRARLDISTEHGAIIA